MAKIIKSDSSEFTHLRGVHNITLCGTITANRTEEEGELTCPQCAKIALHAIELSTKTERKEWRELL